MPSPYTSSAVRDAVVSGNLYIDSLVGPRQWQSGTISYSFPTAASVWSTDPETGYGQSGGIAEPWVSGYEALSTSQQSAVETALSQTDCRGHR